MENDEELQVIWKNQGIASCTRMTRCPAEVKIASQEREVARAKLSRSIHSLCHYCNQVTAQQVGNTARVTRSQEKPALYQISSDCKDCNLHYGKLFRHTFERCHLDILSPVSIQVILLGLLLNKN